MDRREPELFESQNIRPKSAGSPAIDEALFLSDEDEYANTVTHGLGFLLSLLAAPAFLYVARDQSIGFQASLLAFTISMATVYLFSTLSHAVRDPGRRQRLRAWDQGTIYFLIAGTYTPFIWQNSPDGYRTLVLLAVWIAALVGFYSKVLSGYRVNAISTATYVALGWLPAMVVWYKTSNLCFAWMIIGGVCYTGGIAFLNRSETVKYSHAVWHLFVIAGSASHALSIFYLVGE